MKQNEIMAENGQPTTNTGEIILYQPDSNICLEVRMEEETVWLTQAQMAVLFQRSISVISRHIRNIFKEEELVEKSNLHFFANCKFRQTRRLLQFGCNHFCRVSREKHPGNSFSPVGE